MTLPAPLLAWWNAREDREQKLLLGGAVFAAVVVLYALIYPVFAMHSTASKAFQTADGDYHWLRGQIRTLAEIRAETGGALPVFLPANEIREKLESDLKKKTMKGRVAVEDVGDATRIKVRLESGEGRQVMRWLEELGNGGYTVSALSLKNRGGRLTGTFTIEI